MDKFKDVRSASAMSRVPCQGHFPARRLDPWPSLKLPGLPSPSAAPAAPYRDLLRRYLRHFLPYSAPAMLAPPPPASPLRQLSRVPSGTPEARTPQVISTFTSPRSRSLCCPRMGSTFLVLGADWSVSLDTSP